MNMRGKEYGFTRSDLLIVAALISWVAVLQVPLLGNTKSGGQATVCADNLRRLIQAWTMYADDHDGRIVPNNASGLLDGAPRETWAGGWLDYSTSLDNLNARYLVDPTFRSTWIHVSGLLGPYLKSDASVFKCPSDSSTTTVFGRIWPRVRSVSMNSWMGGGVWAGETQFEVFFKLADITQPEPAKALVILDEREDSINDSTFLINMITNLVDVPAYYHDGGANLSFADGHVETHIWTDQRTVPPSLPRRLLALDISMTNNADLDFLRSVATAPR
ncbi:hypothetical protein GC207_11980 [bacterium]|nr:hypothetical protein [bacterium]